MDNLTQYLDRMAKSTGETSKNRLLDFIPKDAKYILDFGCADGFLTEKIATAFPNATIICNRNANELLIKCRLIGTHILLESYNVYANTIPGTLYGIIYRISVATFIWPIICAPPNSNPDTIINAYLYLPIILKIDNLNISSSNIGAITHPNIIIITGLISNSFLTASSLLAIPLVIKNNIKLHT